MSLLRLAFWIALFLASTFCFIVLFEHGTVNFGKNMEAEYKGFRVLIGIDPDPNAKKKDDKDPSKL